MTDVGAPPLLVKFIAPVVIIIVVVVVLLAAIHTSNNESSSLRSIRQSSGWTASNEQFQCLRAAFEREVPRGSSVWVGNPESHNRTTGGAAVTPPVQMLAELATPWAVPAKRSSAQWAASTSTGSECLGLTLHVEPLG